MNSLVIDIGNTNIKAGVFYGEIFQEVIFFEKNETERLGNIIQKHHITQSILSNVGPASIELENFLLSQTKFLKLDHHTKLPFRSHYKTPKTLGMDRVSAVAGSLHFFKDINCLIIDAGTCITYDFITSEEIYMGGAIAPGMQMRLSAMNHFTERLPNLSFFVLDDFVGNTTESSMMSGAFYGIVNEINETINRYEQRYGALQVITCGGDAILFDKHIKRSIFAAPYLVLYGLNKILSFNVK